MILPVWPAKGSVGTLALAVSAGLAAWTCAAGSAGTVLAASSAASPDKVVQVQNKAARIACFQIFTITPPSSFYYSASPRQPSIYREKLHEKWTDLSYFTNV